MKLCNCDVYQLKEIAERKKLVCFGAGKEFFDFFVDFRKLHLEKNLYAVADNDMEKAGTRIRLEGVSVPVIGVEDLRRMKDVILLVSCSDVESIVRQLEDYEELGQTKCFAVHLIRSRTCRNHEQACSYPASFRITREPHIPKKIHYCWFGESEIPKKNRVWMESWEKYCPDYEIIRWDENNYDVSRNQYMYEAYRNKKWGFVPDYARLDILYHHGGIYLDTDVEILKSWEDLRYQEAFMGMETNFGINLGLGFGSVPYYDLWKELMELYEGLRFIKKDGTWDQTPSPQLQEDIFLKKGFRKDGGYQRIGHVAVYPPAVFSPKDLYTGDLLLTPHTYSIHHYDGSWIDREKKERENARKRLYRQFKDINGENRMAGQ